MNSIELFFKNKFFGALLVLVVMIFIVAAYFLFRTPSEIKDLSTQMQIGHQTLYVEVCGSKQLDSISFVRSFDNIKQSKVSGSSPSKFYLLTIYTDAFETHLNIGRDSENEDLYWVYPYEEPKIKIPLGYINLEWFRLPNDLSCDHLVSPWIYDSIPK